MSHKDEIEIKLTAPDRATLDTLWEKLAPLYAPDADIRQRFRYVATYYDTAAWGLLRRRFAFRACKLEADTYRLGIKGNGGVKEGVGQWEELEEDAPHQISRFDELPEKSPLRKRVAELIDITQPLHALLVTDIDRRAFTLWLNAAGEPCTGTKGQESDGVTQVELALDHGTVYAVHQRGADGPKNERPEPADEAITDRQEMPKEGSRRQPLSEVEIELLSGPLEPLARFSRRMQRNYPLTPSRHSKFAIGLQLMHPQALPTWMHAKEDT